MQRSMSYRKPVPTYVPSPPPSPPQASFLSSTQPNLDLEVPPLPPNWREVLDQVGMPPPRLTARSSHLIPIDTEERIEMDMTELPSSIMSEYHEGGNLTLRGDEVAFLRPGTQSTSNVPCPQKRRLHQQYRPPTPPIPSQYKPRHSLLNLDNLISDDADSEVTLAHDGHRIGHFGLYHDYSRGGPGVSSLKISSSFRTDKTMGSFNTLNPSVGWSQGMSTRGSSNCPSLLNHKHSHYVHGVAGDTSESVNPSCWESLGAWATKVWNFVVICK
ncbi:hypothetical protein BYT27DRAFT_7335762 [Phlegmacium glaucopus]|nr:hypothetical protein BYT27DRAFT_7335762 [Phlegmacium glaucopus]